jgi:hypothetical protein
VGGVKHDSEKGVGQIKPQRTVDIEPLDVEKPRRQFQSGSPTVLSDTTSARGSDSKKTAARSWGHSGKNFDFSVAGMVAGESPESGEQIEPAKSRKGQELTESQLKRESQAALV